MGLVFSPRFSAEDGGDTEFPALAKLLSLSDPKPGQPLSLLHQAMASRAEDGVCSGGVDQSACWYLRACLCLSSTCVRGLVFLAGLIVSQLCRVHYNIHM